MAREFDESGEESGVVRDHRGRFVLHPGSAKGTRWNVAEAFLSDLLVHWREYGPDAIHRVFNRRPDKYLQIIASILPKDINLKVGQADDLSETELIQRLNGQLAELARAGVELLGRDDAGGAKEPSRALQALSKTKGVP